MEKPDRSPAALHAVDEARVVGTLIEAYQPALHALKTMGRISIPLPIVTVLLLFATCSRSAMPTQTPDKHPLVVDVYVLDFDPLIHGRPLSKYKGWNQQMPLMQTYIEDVRQSSGGVVIHHITHHATIRKYPEKPGGFVYTNDQYLACVDDPDSASYCRPIIDYDTMLNTRYDPDYGSACEALATKEVDEVWLWGGPWFGYWEAHTIPPHSLCTSVDQPFTVMGFSYERGVAEMLHNLGHRAESALQDALGLELWDQFDGQRGRYTQDYACPPVPDDTHPEVTSKTAHCGNVHFPPNAYCHYQYGRNKAVLSDCDDWLRYPNLTGQQTTIDAKAWGHDHRGYLKWWFSHLPRQPGEQDGVYNNWWKYIYPTATR